MHKDIEIWFMTIEIFFVNFFNTIIFKKWERKYVNYDPINEHHFL